MILAWEYSWFDLAILTYGETMRPTFGETDDDIKVPADDYCLYHCFNYAMSNGTAPLTEDYAQRLRRKITRVMRQKISPEPSD